MNRVKDFNISITGAMVCLLFVFLTTPLMAADQFSVSPVYMQDFMKNDTGREYRFHSPGLNVSFFREGSLDLVFSISAGIPVWLSENNENHISFDYYSYPASVKLLAGPVWSFPMGDIMFFEPSLGLHTGFINLKGTGYSSLQFAPLGIGTDLRLKMEIKPRLTLGLVAGFNWNIIDLQHFSNHDTGYSILAGISAGFNYESGRVERKRRNRE